MTENEDISPEQLRKTADELRDFSQNLQRKFNDAKAVHEKTMQGYYFFSRDRANFWKMPKWLWIPIVGSIVLLFLVALVLV